MVIDPKDIVPFLTWLYPGALLNWLLVVACVAAGATARRLAGRGRAARAGSRPFGSLALSLRDAVFDFVHLSPRRVWALGRLAIQESIRRRVVVVFAVFILILLFAGWFLDPGSTDPARLYLDFVLTATSYLVLLLALFLSSLSLPADMKNRTIYTVVTKPVRASEVVLGRIVGFRRRGHGAAGGDGRDQLRVCHPRAGPYPPTHGRRSPAGRGSGGRRAGRAPRPHQPRPPTPPQSRPSSRRATATWKWNSGTAHKLTVEKSGGKTSLSSGPARRDARGPRAHLRQALFSRPQRQARREGRQRRRRMDLSQLSSKAARWPPASGTSRASPKKAFPNGLPVELNIEVFRTYKGDIEKGVPGSLTVRNPTHRQEGRRRHFRVERISDRFAA